MARKTKIKKDRTGLIISAVFHAVLVAGVIYWAAKTGKINELRQRFLEFVRSQREKRTEQTQTRRPERRPPPPPPSSELPKSIMPPTSSGTRRAVVSDAPAAAGETFFVDARTQVQGPSTGGPGQQQQQPKQAPVVLVVRPVPPPPPMLAPASKSTMKQLLVERAKAAASTEAIGSEQISKAGASDAGAAVTKVAGATIVEGKFAVIRGLSDRYVSTTLNGANLPSPDPYRQSAPLDLFPAQVIDRVVVTKTFTPDQPGTSTGGGIDVMTKSFPERSFLSFSLGGEYNTQSSLNDRFLSYKGGGLDWAGMDDGTRALPEEVSRLAPIGARFPDAPASSGVINTPLYFQSFNNATVVDQTSRSLGTTQFAPTRETTPLNHNFLGTAVTLTIQTST